MECPYLQKGTTVNIAMEDSTSEEEFRQVIQAKYSEHFEHIYALHQLAESSLQSYKGFPSNHYQGSHVLIFGRAYKCYDSIRRLCEMALCEDAGVLLRSLLNLMVVTRWISQDPQTRAKRYFDWYWVSQNTYAQKFPGHVPPKRLLIIQEHFNAVKPQFEYEDKKGQVKFAKHWYEPDARSIRDLFEKVELTEHYEDLYGPLSSIEHSDIDAFLEMTREMNRDGNERRLDMSSDRPIPHYLRNAFQYFGEVFRICNASIQIAEPAKLNQIIEAGIAFYASE